MGNSWACSRCHKLNPPDELTCDCKPRACTHWWELCFLTNGMNCRLCGAHQELSFDKLMELGFEEEKELR